MTVFDYTLGAIIADSSTIPAQAFQSLTKAMAYDSGETANRGSCEFGKGDKGDPYNFAQHLVSRHRGVIIAVPQHFDIVYTAVIKINDKPVVVQLSKNLNVPGDNVIGTALICAKDINSASIQFAEIVKAWKAF